jgi:hypothetical protein
LLVFICATSVTERNIFTAKTRFQSQLNFDQVHMDKQVSLLIDGFE